MLESHLQLNLAEEEDWAGEKPDPLIAWIGGWCCKVAPESWVIGGSKVVSSKGLEGYEMFDPKDSRREDREEENA